MLSKVILLSAIVLLILYVPRTEADNLIYIGGKYYQLDTIPNTKLIVGSRDLESSNTSDLGEILRATPSVEVTSNGGLGQLSSVFFRGTDSNHTLFLLNGVNINVR